MFLYWRTVSRVLQGWSVFRHQDWNSRGENTGLKTVRKKKETSDCLASGSALNSRWAAVHQWSPLTESLVERCKYDVAIQPESILPTSGCRILSIFQKRHSDFSQGNKLNKFQHFIASAILILSLLSAMQTTMKTMQQPGDNSYKNIHLRVFLNTEMWKYILPQSTGSHIWLLKKKNKNK